MSSYFKKTIMNHTERNKLLFINKSWLMNNRLRLEEMKVVICLFCSQLEMNWINKLLLRTKNYRLYRSQDLEILHRLLMFREIKCRQIKVKKLLLKCKILTQICKLVVEVLEYQSKFLNFYQAVKDLEVRTALILT